MDKRITNLFAALENAIQGNLARSSPLPSPWESWTIISLIRQRQRQLWACGVVKEYLGEARGQGIVPAWPEWEYFFHGIGCCLTHRVTGEEIETETGEGFDFFFWSRHLRSWKKPDPATTRMIELHPSIESLPVTLAELAEAGAIDSDDGGVHRFTVSEAAADFTEVVEVFLQLAGDEGTQGSLRQLVEPTSSKVRELDRRRRLRRVLDLLESGEPGPEALYALADLRPEDFVDRLTTALFRTPYSGLNSAAMDIIELEDGAAWCEAVYRLWETAQPHEQSHLWITSAGSPSARLSHS